MQETVIRKKAAFILFALMMLLGAHIRGQQGQTLAAQSPGNAGVQDDAMQSPGNAGMQDDAAQSPGNAGVRDDADSQPRIALTFDDGPHPVYTKMLLDGLRERGVKATFFVIGQQIPGQEDILLQMARDGHLIGNHTYDHRDISKMTRKEACGELQKTSDLVEEATGSATAYVRPPFGNWNEELDGMVSMIAVKWTIDPKDWTTANTSQIVNRTVEKAADNGIILLHDYYESSVKAALEIVDILKERGYRFVTVEELLLD